MMKDLQVLVISLKESDQRRARVEAELRDTGLRWRFLDAVDGSALHLPSVSFDALRVKRLLGFELTPKEVGCYLSHLNAWRACIHQQCPTLIFEDDFVVKPHLTSVLKELVEIKERWQIVRLQALCESSSQLISQHDGWQLVSNSSDPLGATAYLIHPVSANALLTHGGDIYEPLDHYLEHREKHGLNVLAVKPYPVEVFDRTRASSTITDRPERPVIRGWGKWARSWHRWLDRRFSSRPWFPR